MFYFGTFARAAEWRRPPFRRPRSSLCVRRGASATAPPFSLTHASFPPREFSTGRKFLRSSLHFVCSSTCRPVGRLARAPFQLASPGGRGALPRRAWARAVRAWNRHRAVAGRIVAAVAAPLLVHLLCCRLSSAPLQGALFMASAHASPSALPGDLAPSLECSPPSAPALASPFLAPPPSSTPCLDVAASARDFPGRLSRAPPSPPSPVAAGSGPAIPSPGLASPPACSPAALPPAVSVHAPMRAPSAHSISAARPSRVPSPAVCAPSGDVLLRWDDPWAVERAIEYRSRHKHPDEMCGTGFRPGSWRAIKRVNRVLVACGVPGCGTLCAYSQVLRPAKKARRLALLPADGCAAPQCSRSRWHKPSRHAAQQRKWAAALRAGDYVLAERPVMAAQERAPQVEGPALDAAIAAALARVGA